ncbi:MAG: hypothetical protein IT270_13375 [Saprospiraceae bacterium]|nr:hypothetical protein [Saprospiraceae bacterium]
MSNKHFKLPLFVLLATAGIFFTACNNDDDDGTAQENITTIQVHLTGAGIDQEFEWNDLDGIGGNNPVIDTIVVPANTGDIFSHIHVYDRSKTPEVDITDEIEAESLEHLITYAVAGANVNIAYDDTDSNGKPLGIKSIWTSTGASNGTLRIILYHEPSNKDNLSDPGGEVDFDVTFPVRIQ